jgi:hypothetical protein
LKLKGRKNKKFKRRLRNLKHRLLNTKKNFKSKRRRLSKMNFDPSFFVKS